LAADLVKWVKFGVRKFTKIFENLQKTYKNKAFFTKNVCDFLKFLGFLQGG